MVEAETQPSNLQSCYIRSIDFYCPKQPGQMGEGRLKSSIQRGPSFSWHKGIMLLPRRVMRCLKEVYRIHRKVLTRLAKTLVDKYQNVSGRTFVGSRHKMEEILGKFQKGKRSEVLTAKLCVRHFTKFHPVFTMTL